MTLQTMFAVGLAGLTVLVSSPSAFAFGVGGARVGARVGPGGAAVGRAAGAARVGPAGGVRAGGVKSGTYVTPRGTTIQAGKAVGVQAGPLGGVRAGGAQGIRVTTPNGRTYTHGSKGGAAVGPLGGVRVGGASGTAVSGPFGGGYAVGQRGGVAVGPAGVRAGAVRGGVAVNPYGYRVGYRTGYVNNAAFATWGNQVRTGYPYRYFTPAWYTTHPLAWTTKRWATANYWAAVNYVTLANYVGLTTRPIVYDYGTTVVIQNDEVFLNGERLSTAVDYARKATSLAEVGRTTKPTDADEWQPLGVFGLMQGEEEVAQRIFQLGVNKAGVVRGNYYDAVADNTLPVFGSVDKSSQRVAWSIGEKKDIVFEAGLNNLTQNQTTILVHFGSDSSQQMALVRLEEPKDGNK